VPAARWLGDARTIELEDRYIDTAHGALREAGFVARIRVGDGPPRLTVKSIARRGAGAVHRRLELEGEAGSGDDPRDWPASAARARVLAAVGDGALIPLVTIRQRRLQRELGIVASVIEVSLDEVEVAAPGGRIDVWVELEAELRTGSDADLAALGRFLLRRSDVVPATSSKLDRAMAAIGPA
jgi:inorganic triphosphatase YgiF